MKAFLLTLIVSGIPVHEFNGIYSSEKVCNRDGRMIEFILGLVPGLDTSEVDTRCDQHTGIYLFDLR